MNNNCYTELLNIFNHLIKQTAKSSDSVILIYKNIDGCCGNKHEDIEVYINYNIEDERYQSNNIDINFKSFNKWLSILSIMGYEMTELDSYVKGCTHEWKCDIIKHKIQISWQKELTDVMINANEARMLAK